MNQNTDNLLIPEKEPERQYYFIDKVKELVRKKEERKGRKLTYNIQTFGCQMNARDSEKLAGILEEVGYVYKISFFGIFVYITDFFEDSCKFF